MGCTTATAKVPQTLVPRFVIFVTLPRFYDFFVFFLPQSSTQIIHIIVFWKRALGNGSAAVSTPPPPRDKPHNHRTITTERRCARTAKIDDAGGKKQIFTEHHHTKPDDSPSRFIGATRGCHRIPEIVLSPPVWGAWDAITLCERPGGMSSPRFEQKRKSLWRKKKDPSCALHTHTRYWYFWRSITDTPTTVWLNLRFFIEGHIAKWVKQ